MIQMISQIMWITACICKNGQLQQFSHTLTALMQQTDKWNKRYNLQKRVRLLVDYIVLVAVTVVILTGLYHILSVMQITAAVNKMPSAYAQRPLKFQTTTCYSYEILVIFSAEWMNFHLQITVSVTLWTDQRTHQTLGDGCPRLNKRSLTTRMCIHDSPKRGHIKIVHPTTLATNPSTLTA